MRIEVPRPLSWLWFLRPLSDPEPGYPLSKALIEPLPDPARMPPAHTTGNKWSVASVLVLCVGFIESYKGATKVQEVIESNSWHSCRKFNARISPNQWLSRSPLARKSPPAMLTCI